MERTSANKWLIVALIALLPVVAAILWARRSPTGAAARQTPGVIVGPGSGRWGSTPGDVRPARVTPTTQWVIFYSQNTTLDGQPVPVGSIVRAFDPGGQQCGENRVEQAGWYGQMACYADDPTTPGDEGAQPGDRIRFTINDLEATPLGPDEPIWTQNAALLRVDLAATSSTPSSPTATAMPSATPTETPQAPVPSVTASATPSPQASLSPTTAVGTATSSGQARTNDFLPLLLRAITSTAEQHKPVATTPPILAMRASRWCGQQLPRVAPCAR